MIDPFGLRSFTSPISMIFPKLFAWHSSRDIVRMKWRYYQTFMTWCSSKISIHTTEWAPQNCFQSGPALANAGPVSEYKLGAIFCAAVEDRFTTLSRLEVYLYIRTAWKLTCIFPNEQARAYSCVPAIFAYISNKLNNASESHNARIKKLFFPILRLFRGQAADVSFAFQDHHLLM